MRKWSQSFYRNSGNAALMTSYLLQQSGQPKQSAIRPLSYVKDVSGITLTITNQYANRPNHFGARWYAWRVFYQPRSNKMWLARYHIRNGLALAWIKPASNTVHIWRNIKTPSGNKTRIPFALHYITTGFAFDWDNSTAVFKGTPKRKRQPPHASTIA